MSLPSSYSAHNGCVEVSRAGSSVIYTHLTPLFGRFPDIHPFASTNGSHKDCEGCLPWNAGLSDGVEEQDL